MQLFVTVKCVYGNNLVYPACEKSKDFLRALGLKSFTFNAIQAVKSLGYKIEVKNETYSL